MRAYLIIAAIVALIGSHWYAYSAGKDRGRDACLAERATNIESAQKAIDLRDQRSAENNASMIDWLAANVQPIQAKADDSAARIVTVYRDRIVPVGSECSRPDSVQAELDAARARANGTGTALQAKPDAAHSAGTAPAIDR